jgi:hypothetical protein
MRAVLASLVMGETWSGIDGFCIIIGMPPLSKPKLWQEHIKASSEDISRAAEESMAKVARNLWEMRAAEAGGEAPEVIERAVSFDETRAKRGYSSLFGVQAAITVETGKVLDTQVPYILYCAIYSYSCQRARWTGSWAES